MVASPARPVPPAPQPSSMVVSAPHPYALGHAREPPGKLLN
ncbi:conserved hypothetical protein [Cupriavidus taiwanensis]|uniref:Uncharacterized protein n=1 Tax=Cupriavidus taiwanensis TaxID=164546 RepID=A0A375C0R3_9BURK|nr:conserved hypothetical protein [Cupriavidus taiwanensis]